MLTFTRDGQTERCSATLVGARTLLTAATCLDRNATDFEFELEGERTVYPADRGTRRMPVGYGEMGGFDVDLPEGNVAVDAPLHNIGILRLDDEPPLSIVRASLTRTLAPETAEGDYGYRLVGTDSRGRVVETEHPSIASRALGTIWFADTRGGAVEDDDIGGPTLGVVDGHLVVVGVHSASLLGVPFLPFDLSVDTEAADYADALSTAVTDDLCIDGVHPDRSVECTDDDFDTTSRPEDEECGNGYVETGEDCDDENTRDGDGCDSQCEIEEDYECTDDEPSRCGREATCGDGRVEGLETCDDDNTRDDDGCDAECQIEQNYLCVEEPSECDEVDPDRVPECGDGIADLDDGEECDDGDTRDGDGCDEDCRVEDDFQCNLGSPSRCEEAGEASDAECGNGIIESGERCDDDNIREGDGCDDRCEVEDGYLCDDEPSECEAVECGNGIIESGETCDDDNDESGDGCNSRCRPEAGFSCDGEPSECEERMSSNTDAASTGDSSPSGSACSVRIASDKNPRLPTITMLAGLLGLLVARRRQRPVRRR